MLKLIDIQELIEGLQAKGIEAGIAIRGTSSYHVTDIPGDLELWAYVPDNDVSHETVAIDFVELMDNKEFNEWLFGERVLMKLADAEEYADMKELDAQMEAQMEDWENR